MAASWGALASRQDAHAHGVRRPDVVHGDQMWFIGLNAEGGTYAIGYAEAEGEVPEPATFGAGLLGVAHLMAGVGVRRRVLDHWGESVEGGSLRHVARGSMGM